MATPNDIAFVVGIDAYEKKPLRSCVNDAKEIARLLRENDDNSRNFTVDEVCVSKPEDAEDALQRLAFLLRLRGHLACLESQDFLFYFSGHATNNDWGADLLVADGERVAFAEVLRLIYKSRARHVAVILDCCFSGTFASQPKLGADPHGFEPGMSLIRDNVTLLAASKPDQPAVGGSRFSAFTQRIIEGLAGGAADFEGKVMAPALFGYAAPAFGPTGQRPVLKASVSGTEALRTCAVP